MRVLLAGPDFEENLSIRYLASSLQAKRHETSLAVFNSADDVEAVAEEAGEAHPVKFCTTWMRVAPCESSD